MLKRGWGLWRFEDWGAAVFRSAPVIVSGSFDGVMRRVHDRKRGSVNVLRRQSLRDYSSGVEERTEKFRLCFNEKIREKTRENL